MAMSHLVKPLPIEPLQRSKLITQTYHNESLARVNDHEIRMSVMTEQFRWHRHPDSDETFYGIDGELVIDFEDRQLILTPGQMITVPAGTVHRTRPNGARSVNLTFERIDAATKFVGRD